MNKNIRELLDFLNKRKIITGVVTNKHSRYVNPIVKGLGIVSELGCIVTGDMVLNAKPAGDSLIKASEIINVPTKKIVYVGDDERDIIAGRSVLLLLLDRWMFFDGFRFNLLLI